MSAITITQFWNVGKYRLNITLRNNREIDPQTLHHVIADTVAAWMYLAKLIEAKAWDTEIQTSAPNVEAKHLGAAAVEDWNDALVTVWDAEQGGQKIGLTFHSNSSLVTAFVNYIGYQSAMEAVVLKWPSNAEKAQNTRQTPSQDRTHANAPENAQPADNEGKNGHSGNIAQVRYPKDAKALPIGSHFELPRRAYSVVFSNENGTPTMFLYTTRQDGTQNQWPDFRINVGKAPAAVQQALDASGAELDMKAGSGEYIVRGEVVSSDRAKTGKTVRVTELI